MSKPLDASFKHGLKHESDPSGYPENWDEISKEFRKKRNYTCADCGVCCEKDPGLTDAHHVNGDKSNCAPENLQCLCKYHHHKRHAHYKPKESEMRRLERLWNEQNIPLDKPK
ncbi:MAG: HNH endonuclease [Alphaproteobacteria bacterium]|nr:HNH endonuclease [Alphaproteobacteria bacterium]